VVHDPGLKKLLFCQNLRPLHGILLNPLNGLKNIPTVAPDRPSQRHRFSKHPISNARPEAALGYNIDFRLKHRLQIDQQATEIEQTAVRLQIHEKINVALGIAVAACDRSKDADISRSAFGGNAKNLLAPCGPEFLQSHSTSILSRNCPPAFLSSLRRAAGIDERVTNPKILPLTFAFTLFLLSALL
jgi:hypothetical protein